MRIVNKPVDMIAVFMRGEDPRPKRFRFRDHDDTERIINVQKIISITEDSFRNDPTFIYECQSKIGTTEKRLALKYHINNAKWELYKYEY